MIESIQAEFARYKVLAEGAMAQLPDDALIREGPGRGNSIAVICWHISGNLRSRFSDFLTSDGEKPWRVRDEEFADRRVSRQELFEKWEQGWGVLLATLTALTDGDLDRTVTIREVPLTVHEALHRSLAHISYHVGQIVYVAHCFKGTDWKYLSIPPGASAEYNRKPLLEKAADQAASLPKARPR